MHSPERPICGANSRSLQAARAVRDRLAELSGERERTQRLEFLRFQFAAMSELGLTEGELGDLEQEHRVLADYSTRCARTSMKRSARCRTARTTRAICLGARAAKAVQEAAAIDGRLEDAAADGAD